MTQHPAIKSVTWTPEQPSEMKRIEAEGRAAYPAGRNPYPPGGARNNAWVKGWHQADTAHIAATGGVQS